jgi:hypothetical protein
MRCALLRPAAAMPNYRRALAAGGCWFFTVSLSCPIMADPFPGA